ncbi:MAG: hypothetical protein METHAR1v1_310001 [Methanothrix sp.]|nr:MAG: hypothetical protein METHAR1v1_310001 [Methanothrix sp.]
MLPGGITISLKLLYFAAAAILLMMPAVVGVEQNFEEFGKKAIPVVTDRPVNSIIAFGDLGSTWIGGTPWYDPKYDKLGHDLMWGGVMDLANLVGWAHPSVKTAIKPVEGVLLIGSLQEPKTPDWAKSELVTNFWLSVMPDPSEREPVRLSGAKLPSSYQSKAWGASSINYGSSSSGGSSSSLPCI